MSRALADIEADAQDEVACSTRAPLTSELCLLWPLGGFGRTLFIERDAADRIEGCAQDFSLGCEPMGLSMSILTPTRYPELVRAFAN
jgi:hypothetical protein